MTAQSAASTTLLPLLLPVLLLFFWQLWRSLDRFAGGRGGRPRKQTKVLLLAAAALLVLWIMLKSQY